MLAILHVVCLSWLALTAPERYDVIEVRIEYQTSLHLEGEPQRLTRTIDRTETTLYAWNNHPKFGWTKQLHWFSLNPGYGWSIQQAGPYTQFMVPGSNFWGSMESTRWVRQIVHADLDGDGAMKAWLITQSTGER